jgi:hypothetical protein
MYFYKHIATRNLRGKLCRMPVVEQSDTLTRIPFWVGLVIRIYIILFHGTIASILDDRVEVNTPLTSSKRCTST